MTLTFELLARAVRVGALLPDVEDVDFDDPAAVAELKLTLAEFSAACAAVETFIMAA